MRIRTFLAAGVLTVAAGTSAGAADAVAAAPSTSAASQVEAVYRTVLTAEYFGPASGVCSHLTSSGAKSYTAGGTGSCTATFAAGQKVLTHKTAGVDDSGYTPAQWRSLVTSIMSHLKVTVSGTHASAIGGQSGIPGKTTLVKTGGKWAFTSAPPSVSS